MPGVPTVAQVLEAILGKPIVDATAAYAGMEAESLLSTYRQLGLIERLAPAERERLLAWLEAVTGARPWLSETGASGCLSPALEQAASTAMSEMADTRLNMTTPFGLRAFIL